MVAESHKDPPQKNGWLAYHPTLGPQILEPRTFVPVWVFLGHVSSQSFCRRTGVQATRLRIGFAECLGLGGIAPGYTTWTFKGIRKTCWLYWTCDTFRQWEWEWAWFVLILKEPNEDAKYFSFWTFCMTGSLALNFSQLSFETSWKPCHRPIMIWWHPSCARLACYWIKRGQWKEAQAGWQFICYLFHKRNRIEKVERSFAAASFQISEFSPNKNYTSILAGQ